MKITDIKQQVKQAGRYSVFVDGKFAFGLSESALLEQGLAPGQEIDDKQLDELKKAAGLDKAYNNALRFAAMRPRSEGEMADYFRRKNIDDEAAKQITSKLKKVGLLDDLAFARAWVSNRRLLKNTSKRKLRQELKQKHVSEEIVEKVLQEDEGTDQDALKDLIAKKRHRYSDQQKFMAYLARQGFSFDDIKQGLSENYNEK